MPRVLIALTIWGGSQGASALTPVNFALFSKPQKVSHRDYVVLRNGQFRNMRFSYGRPFEGVKSGIVVPGDDFRRLALAYRRLDTLKDNIFELDELNLFEGASSDHFWSYVNSPTYKGGLALREGVKSKKFDWPEFREDFLKDPPEKLYSSGRVSEMSAASKYDLLLGDEGNIFKREFAYAESVFKKFGKVPHWAGICHGTAPASFLYPEPTRSVTVLAHDGRNIEFTVNDIKRLAAHAWGENWVPHRQVGLRCYLDELGSREPRCLDTNPATFHLALLNYIGINKKTFIIDNAYDSMVWNRPVMSYKFYYRNPVSKLPSQELQYSMVELSSLANDLGKGKRSPSAYYLVGVQMIVELLYGVENGGGGGANTAYKIVYYYDLEVDRDGRIVGGEWETLYHPDFIWAINEGATPQVNEDFELKDTPLWDGTEPLGKFVRGLGLIASRRGQLMEYVVRSLVELSKNTQGERNDNHLQRDS